MEELTIKINGKDIKVKVEEVEDKKLRIYSNGESFDVELKAEGEQEKQDIEEGSYSGTSNIEIKAPIPGMVSKINVAKGDKVKEGQNILSFSAMKMENEVKSPIDGTIKDIKVKQNSNFNKGDTLIIIH
jgi:biotin carboxyl carrier protein